MDGSIKRTTLFIVHFLCMLPDVSAQNQCYACNYAILRSDNITDGPEECYEPFFNATADGISRVDCDGECDYIVQETSDIFQVTRGCSLLDPCLESASTTEDGGSFTTHCCSGSLCNDETIANEPAESLGDGECYTCTYVKGASGTVGSPGCYEPFDASAVGVVKTQCNSTCELTVIKSGEDLTVVRDCLDSVFECETSCVPSGGDSVCTYCCSPGTVCNTLTTTKEPAESLGDNECYTCSYVKSASGTVGSPGCYEPFDASAVGVVKTQCNSICELTVIKSGEDLTVGRDCLDSVFECETSCVPSGGDSVCTYCCSPGTVCNTLTTTKEPVESLGDNECYTCSYVKSASGTVGSPGCYEPFDASAVGVEKTQCDSTCELTVINSGEDLTVTRGCDDFGIGCETSCVTSGGESVCTYCCSPGTVCNKSALNFLSPSLFLSTIFVCFGFFI